jgi:adenylate kinase
MIVTLFGPPGAGKGTQGALLSQHLDIPHLSTGDMLRDITASGSELGHQVASLIDEGNFVPDAMIRDVIAERFSAPDCSNGAILDGFPRTVAQVPMLDALLASRTLNLDAAILLDVSDSVLLERIAKRGAAPNSVRADDRPKIAVERLVTYRKKTAPLLDIYRQEGRLQVVDGAASPACVFDRLLASLNLLRASA